MESQLSLIYTTFSTEEDALRITRQLLEKHVVACINLLSPLKSIYVWEGQLEETQEIGALLKTTREKVPLAMEILQDLHPYDVPVILEIPLGRGEEHFIKWVQDYVR
jgi:periplasmic divalent cation tolerance protein